MKNRPEGSSDKLCPPEPSGRCPYGRATWFIIYKIVSSELRGKNGNCKP
jgi:hypothetical protein